MLKIFLDDSLVLILLPCRIDLKRHQFFDVFRRDSETRGIFLYTLNLKRKEKCFEYQMQEAIKIVVLSGNPFDIIYIYKNRE